MESSSNSSAEEAPCGHDAGFAERHVCRQEQHGAKLTPRSVSVEDLVRKCRASCPLLRIEEHIRQQLAMLRREHEKLQECQHELQAENKQLKFQVASFKESRLWLRRWVLRPLVGGGIMLICAAGLTGAYYWFCGASATTPMGRFLLQALDSLHGWRAHAAAVTDDMTVMGPFIHFAADCVRQAKAALPMPSVRNGVAKGLTQPSMTSAKFEVFDKRSL
mmetsp:Transcript_88044/g.247477  ORF Transcript_88044/g.247477 Transcript_88044/m.247477 type:complete len:219 (+) Transcript_88044:173-829(+)